jgi:sporulation protein YlmC with PRC-barrel domain
MDIRLTELIGRSVHAADGNVLGRVVDLVTRISDDLPVVTAVLVGHGHTSRGQIAYADISDLSSEHLRLRPGSTITSGGAESVNDLRLDRDLLDAQVFDISGGRLVRVGDVLLVSDPDQLRVAGIEVGMSAVVRRLGLGWFAHRMTTTMIAWPDLHLTSGRGLAAHLQASTPALHRLSSAQLAALLAHLPTHDAVRVLHHIGPAPAAAALQVSHRHRGARLIHALPEHLAAAVLDHLPLHDAIALLQHIPAHDVTAVLRHSDPQRAQALTEALTSASRMKTSQTPAPSTYPRLRTRRLRLPPRASRRMDR